MDNYEKKYKEALEWARKVMHGKIGFVLDDVLEKFPELKESEDERIRKWLIHYFKEVCDNVSEKEKKGIVAWLEKQSTPQVRTGLEWVNTIDDACDKRYLEEYAHGEYCHEQSFKWGFQEGVDWLEKQGQQKSAENAEPKFKVGDWYQCIKDFFGKGVTFNKNTAYYCAKKGCLQNEYGCHIAIVKDLYDNFKLWTIQDAKDGDILATQDHILIFEKLLSKDGGVSYCHYDFGCSKPQFDFNKDSNWYFGKEAKVYPATKEQRDQLEKAMADAGYTFDFDKKELKKIINKEQIKKNLQDNSFRRMFENKPTEWNEEDGEIVETLNEYVKNLDILFSEIKIGNKDILSKEFRKKVQSWLKSLKDRVQPQTKHELSEEDEAVLDALTRRLEGEDIHVSTHLAVKCLKSLRPHSQWKPSDGQMDNK